MKSLFFKKRGAMVLVYMIMGLIVIAVMIPIMKYIKTTSDASITQEFGINPDDDFVPFDYEEYLSEEEKIALNSVNTLITSLNALVRDEKLDRYKKNLIDNTDIKGYRITYLSKLDIIDFFSLSNPLMINYYPNWVFTKKTDVKVGQPTISEYWVRADYSMAWCDDKGTVQCPSPLNEKGFNFPYNSQPNPTTCECDGRPSNPYDSNKFNVLPDKIKNMAKEKNMPLVRDLQKIMQVILEVDYNNGSSCLIKSDNNLNDLWTWGLMEDRDGDGIKGGYSTGDNNKDSDVGKKIEQVMSQRQLKILSDEQKQAYFPDGIVTEISGEGCLDSPTWLECPGIRVYYCGKKGGAPIGSKPIERYFKLESDNNIHSLAGAKFMTVISDFKQEQTSINPSNSDVINIAGATFNTGDIDYAEMFNFDGPPNYYQGKKITGGEYRDPKTYCYGGQNYSNVLVKCDENECNICNFNLPQIFSSKSAKDFIAGAGDPKYLVYYEAFPDGEDEAWTVSVGEVTLWGVVVQDIFFSGLPSAIRYTKRVIGTVGRVVGRIPGLRNGVSLIRSGARAIRTAKTTALSTAKNIAKNAAKKGSNAFNALFRNSDELYNTIKNSDNFVEKEVTDIAKVLMDNKKSFDYISDISDGIDTSYFAKSSLDKFSASLSETAKNWLSDRGPKYTVAYLIALNAYKVDVSNQKFMPVGVDKIAFKINQNDPLYSGGGIQSLDSKISGYYLQLVKDKNKGIISSRFDQNGQRFFLASPCEADIKLYKTQCLCRIPSSEGFVYLEQDKKILAEKPTTDGNWISVINETVDLKTNSISAAVKFCMANDDYTNYNYQKAAGLVYTPSCILIDPTVKPGSFCYKGSSYLSEVLGYGIIGANLAGSVITSAGILIPGIGWAGKLGSQLIIDISTAYALHYAKEVDGKWPAH